MTETEIYKELGSLTKNESAWDRSIPYVAGMVSAGTTKIKAKALWMLGEMGLVYPAQIAEYVPIISGYLASSNPLLRERALNALGRIGRGDHSLVESYFPQMRPLAADAEPAVRLAFIWACENIAVNDPTLFEKDLPLFASLLDDGNERVRIEAPEIFRVLGGRIPEAVVPYRAALLALSEKDENQVVRIHAAGAVRAMDKACNKKEDI